MINWEDEMNNNFYEIPNDWYSEFNGQFMNNMPNMERDLVNPKVGFDRGNLFNDLYKPYKNYNYKSLKANNKKEELLYNIMMYNFALTEMNLYLDLHPDNTELVNLYNRYLSNKQELVKQYENSFGPLTLDGINVGTNKWNWNNTPWPWEESI